MLAERCCRSCGRPAHESKIEAAHVVGRVHDRPADDDPLTLVVHADDVVPLCVECHRAYDAHELDLLPVLSRAEQVRAVLHVGLLAALKRVSGRRS